ncbi:MAG: hypothetical protein WCO25_00255 [Candidatus Uhrbacteria bacterium]
MIRLVSMLIASLVLAFATIGGLAVLGMEGDGMQMDAGHGSMDCLSHCLGVASSASTGIASAIVSTVGFATLFVLLLIVWQSSEAETIPSIVRWREGIGKRYRQRELAVVRIQD